MEDQEQQLTPEQQKENQVLGRLIEVYDQINEAEDIAYKTASFLTISNYYSYAIRISNTINNRQGRNRLTITYDTAKLMTYSLDTDVNDILDKQLTELLIEILNTYLADKQDLPSNKPRIAAGTISRVKALFIMLVSTNQYSIIPLLHIPPYVMNQVGKLFDNIQNIKEEVLSNWIEYLESSGNKEMADIVRQAGNAFWGSEGIKPNVIYDRYFGHLTNIIKPVETYEAYIKFRSEYRKSTKNILPSKIYDIFDITPDAYDKARKNVYMEIQQLFPDQEVINKIIYEQ